MIFLGSLILGTYLICRAIIALTEYAVLTGTTCYPFHYIGDAPDRYILTADLI
jgi:sortase A